MQLLHEGANGRLFVDGLFCKRKAGGVGRAAVAGCFTGCKPGRTDAVLKCYC